MKRKNMIKAKPFRKVDRRRKAVRAKLMRAIFLADIDTRTREALLDTFRSVNRIRVCDDRKFPSIAHTMGVDRLKVAIKDGRIDSTNFSTHPRFRFPKRDSV